MQTREIIRQQRLQKFRQEHEQKFREAFRVQDREHDILEVNTDKFGIFFYYPATDRIMFRKTKRWQDKGLKWLEGQFKINLT